MNKSETLFQEAVTVMPGGVNSPVRAFGSVGTTPRFIKSAKGAYLYDEDGSRYIDYVGSWGPMILGHAKEAVIDSVVDACKRGLSFGAATAIEVEMARLVCELIPSIEMVRMVNSGTEAVMSAIRLARGYTGRNKIIKFTGCYHGHSDGLLVKAGSGVMTAGVPDSLGVPAGCTKDTLSAEYNNLNTVTEHFQRCGEEIAAVIVEPVAANMGVVAPKPGFLKGLRSICEEYGALLIFDEVITGFRLGIDGAQGYYGVKPDLTTFGKIIGGGMPVGAYGGRREIMELVSPVGGVYQAGTLSGNPVAMAAGVTQLTILKEHPEYYTELNEKADKFYCNMQEILKKSGYSWQVNHVGSLGCLYFTETEVTDYESAKTSDTEAFAAYCKHMMAHGVYLAPSQFEAMFLSLAHTEEILNETLKIMEQYFLAGCR
ncbi:glutamate-1-semialdehyde-2,1-aminomutase [Petralouisia muris]|jgi:glutamate-1-semialdehyde 2,1-aminomutase|uniref:Glutamate-1-semialdehyde-2,1-aminomutase n=1 Tax=Petralouisia muris TaxID=3032872 RepID=A0AC61RVT9_9FIRM|nr:glutamate-1-semialdehyde 2,1-aminomutase [Petralouisia muris]TGY95867.1 glutamate-1-semialdehyde-2,1-aminomutase [Petralouisia muris]